jgi:hypothetical protein
MAGNGSGGAIPGVVLGTVSQVNGLLGAALAIFATYKAAREAWKAAHPGAASPFKEDAELIDLLASDADGLVAHADAIRAKHLAGAAEAGGPTGGV